MNEPSSPTEGPGQQWPQGIFRSQGIEHDQGSDTVRATPEDSRPLLYFSLYRCVLAAVLLLVVLWQVSPGDATHFNSSLFNWVVLSYLVLAGIALIGVVRRWARMDRQVVLQVVIDIIAISLLVQAAGGLGSGFALLLVITVAGGSILTHGRIAIWFAALASLALLTQQLWAFLHEFGAPPLYTHAGFLGISFFATSFLISAFARQLRASEALAARQEVYLASLAELNEHIIQRMQSGVLAVDQKRRVWMMNRSAQHLLGVAHWQSGRPIDSFSEALDAAHRRWVNGEESVSVPIEPSGDSLRVFASFAGMGEQGSEGTVVFLEDAAGITQRAQQLKLASLGRLSASIAHEIRNPLGSISHAAQLLDESDGLDSADHRLTDIINENAARMNEMVENILEMGRGRNAEPESLVLREWLLQFLATFEAHRAGASAHIRTHIEPADLQVRVDPSQLHQVVWNLCDNAFQHAGEPAMIHLNAGIGEHTERPYLDISDNGTGINGQDRDRVFEPFFTTRSQGSGLGLYIARELCEGNQASLTIESSRRPALDTGNSVTDDAANNGSQRKGCRFRITFQDPRRRRRREME